MALHVCVYVPIGVGKDNLFLQGHNSNLNMVTTYCLLVHYF